MKDDSVTDAKPDGVPAIGLVYTKHCTGRDEGVEVSPPEVSGEEPAAVRGGLFADFGAGWAKNRSLPGRERRCDISADRDSVAAVSRYRV